MKYATNARGSCEATGGARWGAYEWRRAPVRAGWRRVEGEHRLGGPAASEPRLSAVLQVRELCNVSRRVRTRTCWRMAPHGPSQKTRNSSVAVTSQCISSHDFLRLNSNYVIFVDGMPAVAAISILVKVTDFPVSGTKKLIKDSFLHFTKTDVCLTLSECKKLKSRRM